MSYPTGRSVDFSPNAFGEATKVGNFISAITYHPTGTEKTVLYSNGITRSVNLNYRNLPSDIFVTDAAGYDLSDLGYSYDSAVNINLISDRMTPSYKPAYGLRWPESLDNS